MGLYFECRINKNALLAHWTKDKEEQTQVVKIKSYLVLKILSCDVLG